MLVKSFQGYQNDFFVRARQYLRATFPATARSMSDPVLTEFIKASILKANQYEFTSEADVMRFIDLQWRLGFSFDTEEEWATEILTDTGIDTVMKIRLLRDGCAMLTASALHQGQGAA